MWGDRERIEEEVTTQQILQGDKRSWKLITVHGNKYTGIPLIAKTNTNMRQLAD